MTPNVSYEIGPFFVIRAALLPLEQLFDYWEARECQELPNESSQPGFDHGVIHSRICSDEFLEAVSVASPGFFARMAGKEGAELKAKEIYALEKYFLRITSRSTPFGLFSTVSTGEFPAPGHSTRIHLDEIASVSRLARIDLQLLQTLSSTFRASVAKRSESRVYLNPTCRVSDDRAYVVTTNPAAGGVSFGMEKIEYTYEVFQVLEILGPLPQGLTIRALSERLLSRLDDVSQAEIFSFIDDLIDSQILMDSKIPDAFSAEPGADTLSAFAEAGSCESTEFVSLMLQKLKELNKRRVGRGTPIIQEVYSDAQQIPISGISPGRAVRTDAHRPISSSVFSRYFLGELSRAPELVLKLCRRKTSPLSGFTSDFRARYDNSRVPFLEALDPDTGIPYGSWGVDAAFLLSGLRLGGNLEVSSPTSELSPEADQLLTRLYFDALDRGDSVVKLEKQHLEDLPAVDPDFSDQSTLMALVKLIGDWSNDNDTQRIHIGFSGGTSVGQLLGRFTHVDESLSSLLCEFLSRADERVDPNAIHAEVVYLPRSREANVLSRARLRDAQLVVYGIPSPSATAIPLRDVDIDISDNRVNLYHRPSQKRIISYLSSAHNVRGAKLHYYQFLSDLQNQGRSVNGLSWPNSVERHAIRTPRLESGKLILLPETWRFSADQLSMFRSPQESNWKLVVDEFRQEHRLKDRIEMMLGDNYLPFDLSSDRSAYCFYREMRKAQRVLLREMLFDNDCNFVSSELGHHAHELAVPMMRVQDRSPLQSPLTAPVHSSEPSRLPMNEWIYLRVLGGTKMNEECLLALYTAFIKPKMIDNQIQDWFFVRYREPRPSLRLRFRVVRDASRTGLLDDALCVIQDCFSFKHGQDVEVCTYRPEYRRYGGARCMEAAHQYFCAESTLVVSLLLNEGALGTEERGLLIIWLTDTIWRQLCERESERVEVYEQRCLMSVGSKSAKVRLDKKFRSIRPRLEKALSGKLSEHLLDESALVNYAYSLREYSSRLTSILASERRDAEIREVFSSIAHMAVNRLALSQGPEQETVAYEMLFRWYRSAIARANSGKRSYSVS
ncbi:MAG: lantibiotic dehydratase [Pseudomonadota bacterium]